MTTEAETRILSALTELTHAVASLGKALNAGEKWPKSPAQFAAHVGRSERTVQDWIESGKLKANTKVKPALITRGNAERFLEGGK